MLLKEFIFIYYHFIIFKCVLKASPLVSLTFHNTHQRAQHSEGTKRQGARHVAKLFLQNYQSVKSCTALLECKTLLGWNRDVPRRQFTFMN